MDPMTERKRTKRQERSHVEMMAEIDAIDGWWRDRQLKDRVIPPEWHRLDTTAPVRPRKTAATLRYDDDLLRWYRGLGRGYQGRMNAVLRAYMLAVICKEIERLGDRDSAGRPI
jgi:uncharacterized protein (DUF4415 family)